MSYTPGPWEMRQDRNGVEVRGENDQHVAWCGKAISSLAGVTPHEANARLIAAAPDMLEALEAIASSEFTWSGEHYIVSETAYERVCAAIAKAKGE